MSGLLQALRTSRLADIVRDLDDARRRAQELCDPLALRRLRVIGIAASAPVVIAVGVSTLSRYLPATDDVDLPPPTTPVPAIVAAPWTPSTPPASTTPLTTTTTSAPRVTTTTTSADGAEHDTLKTAEGLSSALARHGIAADDVTVLLRALRGALPARALQAGAPFSVSRSGASLQKLVFSTQTDDGVPRTITAVRRADPSASSPTTAVGAADATATTATTVARATTRAEFEVSVDDAAVDVVVEGLAGRVRTTLPEGIVAAGGDAALVDRFVDVFAWDVDFLDEARAGDEFRVLVEKRYATVGDARRFLGYGKVVAAEYVAGGQVHRAFAYTSADGRIAGVFDESGASRRRTLMKNPVDLAAVTSTRAARSSAGESHGLDYDAPLGTPVWSTGDGVVVDARFDKAAGNRIVVDHGGRLTTEYLHLSRFADGIKPGAHVTQKQLLGYVGSTGNANGAAVASANGPHLRYALRRGGSIVDVDNAGAAAVAPLPVAYRPSFEAFVAPLLAQLRTLARA